MKLIRTANAGILLQLDGISILLDGVCREVSPYPATPPAIRAQLTENWPDVVGFTHNHKDHYDPAYAAAYLQQTGRVILGPGTVKGSMERLQLGNVRITPRVCRHIGLAGKTTPHAGFVVEGSQCLWFTGDSPPGQWRDEGLPKPDVLVVPYAYANTPASWEAAKSFGAKTILLLHMPEREADSLGLWSAVEATVGDAPELCCPSMGEEIII